MRTLALLCVLSATATAAADELPPEAKKVVDAWLGHWRLEAPVPGGKASLSFDCKKIALGRGVACNGHGTIPGVGPAEETFIFATDAAKAVHLMNVNSLGEVRDQKCSWKDDKTLGCEDVSYTWTDAKNLTFTTGAGKDKVSGTGKKR